MTDHERDEMLRRYRRRQAMRDPNSYVPLVILVLFVVYVWIEATA